MKILALDSSSTMNSVALVEFVGEGQTVLYERNTPHERSDSSSLFRSLGESLLSGGQPDALCVGIGPGSYNGLRASVAVARAWASARQIPLHAIPSPLAIPGPEEGFQTAGDARGGHYWIASVRESFFVSSPVLMTPDQAITHLQRSPWPIYGTSLLPGIEGLGVLSPSAIVLARLAHQRDPLYLFPHTPEPIYLKPPHITQPRRNP